MATAIVRPNAASDQVFAPTAIAARPNLKPLTGLRFATALLVVLFHFLRFTPAHGSGPAPILERMVLNLVAGGDIGVNFFFILSGFILAYNYLDARGSLRIGSREFWVARVARIYPVYLLALFVAFIPFLRGYASGSILRNVFTGVTTVSLTQAWLPFARLSWNPPGWSLSVEAFFYLVFPVVALYMARLGRRQLVVLLAVVWAGYLFLTVGATILAPHALIASQADVNVQRLLRILWYSPYVRLPEFLAGIALGRLFLLDKEDVAKNHGVYPSILTVASFAAAIAIVAVLLLNPFSLILMKYVVCDPLFAVLIYGLASTRSPLASFFALTPVVLLGEASYALYILHFPVADWMRLAINTSSPLWFPTYLVVALTLSLISLLVVERPARQAIRRAWRHRDGARGSTTVGTARETWHPNRNPA